MFLYRKHDFSKNIFIFLIGFFQKLLFRKYRIFSEFFFFESFEKNIPEKFLSFEKKIIYFKIKIRLFRKKKSVLSKKEIPEKFVYFEIKIFGKFRLNLYIYSWKNQVFYIKTRGPKI